MEKSILDVEDACAAHIALSDIARKFTDEKLNEEKKISFLSGAHWQKNNLPPNWVSIEERLPEENSLPKYLVLDENGDIDIAGFKSAYAGIWPKATHWMPLPQPPLTI